MVDWAGILVFRAGGRSEVIHTAVRRHGARGSGGYLEQSGPSIFTPESHMKRFLFGAFALVIVGLMMNAINTGFRELQVLRRRVR